MSRVDAVSALSSANQCWRFFFIGRGTTRVCRLGRCVLVVQCAYPGKKSKLNHALLVVGYNTTADTPYWIVKNSYGTGWGVAGYLYVTMGEVHHVELCCKVMSGSVYVVLIALLEHICAHPPLFRSAFVIG
jgi:hypothetical protein